MHRNNVSTEVTQPQPVDETISPTYGLQEDRRRDLPVRVAPTTLQDPKTIAAKGLTQTFGLDYRAAILTILIDLMVFGADTISGELLLPVGVGVAGVLGFIVYKIQRKWYGDEHDSALIKALIVGLLTAIPVPITPFVAIPGGLVGLLGIFRRK